MDEENAVWGPGLSSFGDVDGIVFVLLRLPCLLLPMKLLQGGCDYNNRESTQRATGAKRSTKEQIKSKPSTKTASTRRACFLAMKVLP